MDVPQWILDLGNYTLDMLEGLIDLIRLGSEG